VPQAEGGGPGRVDRGGQQLDVLSDTEQAAHAGSSATMPAAQQVGELAFHFGRIAG
jgi:hypothetical protein